MVMPKGRALLEEELDFMLPVGWRTEMEWLVEQGRALVLPGVDLEVHRCNRCGGGEIVETDCGSCQQICGYCETCLQLGRSRACTKLYLIADDEEGLERRDATLHWDGSLTSAQQEAADQAVDIVNMDSQRLLIWAVCVAHYEYISSKNSFSWQCRIRNFGTSTNWQNTSIAQLDQK